MVIAFGRGCRRREKGMVAMGGSDGANISGAMAICCSTSFFSIVLKS